jgi:hypothetical protein
MQSGQTHPSLEELVEGTEGVVVIPSGGAGDAKAVEGFLETAEAKAALIPEILSIMRELIQKMPASSYFKLLAAYGCERTPTPLGPPWVPPLATADGALEQALAEAICLGRGRAFVLHAKISAEDKRDDADLQESPGGTPGESGGAPAGDTADAHIPPLPVPSFVVADKAGPSACVLALLRCPAMPLRVAIRACVDSGVDLAEFHGERTPVMLVRQAAEEGCLEELSSHLLETGLGLWPRVAYELRLSRAALEKSGEGGPLHVTPTDAWGP